MENNELSHLEELKSSTASSYSKRFKRETSISSPWPDPLSSEAYYGLAGELVNTIEPHTEADPAAILIQFLVVFGSLIGRCGFFSAEADRHHTNLFIVLVGQTAKGRKGSSFGHVIRLAEAIDPDWAKNKVKSGLASGEGLTWQVRDPIASANSNEIDSGILDKRLLIIESEFASTLKVVQREGNTLSPVVRDAWDGRNLSTLTKNKPALATHPHISIIGHITNTEVGRYLSQTESANGFGNRFLWVCTKRSKCLPDGGKFLEEDAHQLINRVKASVDFAKTCGRISRDSIANQLWHDLYEELSDGKSGLLGAMTGRREAQVMRIALIYALLDCSLAITKDHLLAALAVEGYCYESCKHIFGVTLENPLARKILEALASSPDGLTRTEISDKVFQRNKTHDEIEAALQILSGEGLAHSLVKDTDGRPAEIWHGGKDSSTN